MDNTIRLKINRRCVENDYTFSGFISGTYKNIFSKLILKCNKDQHIWYPTCESFLKSKKGCPKCGGKLPKSEDEMINIIKKNCAEKNYIFIGFPKNSNTTKSKFKIKCNNDNHTWETTYNRFVSHKYGCPKCSNNIRLDEIAVIKNVKKICGERKYQFIGFVNGKYANNKTKLKIKCTAHNIEWDVRYQNFTQQAAGCPVCNESKGELHIRQYLYNHNIKFQLQKRFDDCKNIQPLPFDFYLPELNICIEYDGIQHYKYRPFFGKKNDLQNLQIRDKIKTDYCMQNKITLLRINYKESIVDKLDKLFA